MADLAQAFSEVKSLPDHILQKELSSPTGSIPGWLALGEIHERKRLRASTGGGDPNKRPSMAEEYAGSVQPLIAGAGLSQPPQPEAMPPPNAPPTGGGGIADLPQQQLPPQGYASGGIVGLARGGQVGSIEAYIRQSAIRQGINPDIAVAVARSEGGLHDLTRQSEVVKNGVREQSYGPFQLYMRGGLGNRALAAGIDPRKESDAYKGIDFALAEAKNKGWGQWYGAAKAGIGDWAGIKDHGGGVYPTGDPNGAAAGVASASDVVATQAADTAGKMAGAETSAADAMSEYLLAQQMMASFQPQQQAVAAAPPPQARPAQQSFDVEPYLRRRSVYG